MNYSVGDVLFAHVAYTDGSGTKARPVVVVHINHEKSFYIVCECYSDKPGCNYTGILIKEDMTEYKECGFLKNSWITYEKKKIIEILVIRKMGVYSKIQNLINKVR